MFKNLQDRLGQTLANITGNARLTEDNIKDTLREVRMALLEADVALKVVREFTNRIRDRAVGHEVSSTLSPGQAFVKIVHEELVHVMGDANEELDLTTQPPAIVLLAGLQGAGKTTVAAKLALYLKERFKKTTMLASVDVYRPAAIAQLETLAGQVDALFCPTDPDAAPVDIAKNAIAAARSRVADVLIIDTAGRLHIDEDMMAEIGALHAATTPIETLFVVDAMTGQDAANTAKAFADALPLTGVILTKIDGDARGGAALSVRNITGAPIKFMGVGEKVEDLEAFHPDRIASRILGMGDVLTLIEEAEQKLDRQKADKLARKLARGKKFDLEDFRDQLQQMKSMGGVTAMLEKLPGMGNISEMAKDQMDERVFVQMEAIIDSMTPHERQYPDVLNGSRKRRIAGGSGTDLQDINRMLKQHKQMQKMMKKMTKKGGMQRMMRGLQGAQGGAAAIQSRAGRRRR